MMMYAEIMTFVQSNSLSIAFLLLMVAVWSLADHWLDARINAFRKGHATVFGNRSGNPGNLRFNRACRNRLGIVSD
jgi:hypothetical protein